MFILKHTHKQIPFVLRKLYPIACKHSKIDYTKVPQLDENDLMERFVAGSGPGGSAVNKNSNCVVLTHNPTGIVVKCHLSRSQDDNRKMARDMIINKLDIMYNGEQSVAAQKKRIAENKFRKSEYKKKKLAKLKTEWKEREGIE